MKRREFVQGALVAGAATAAGSREVVRAWTAAAPARRVTRRLDDGWRFLREDAPGAEAPAFDDAKWEAVTLPHTARIEALETGPPGSPTYQWQGLCWYRRTLRLGAGPAGQVLLRFDGAMNVAEVWLDGQRLGGHMGGYLPFVLDLTGRLTPGRDHVLAVRLDNRDNAVTGPKPLAQLDFNMYGGLYRHVWLIQKDALHITDPLQADKPAGGGVFVTYPRIAAGVATVRVQTHVRNDLRRARALRVRSTLLDPTGSVVARDDSPRLTLAAGAEREVVQELEVRPPQLWSPASPTLYTLESELVTDAGVADAEHTRIGIRRLEIGPEGCRINGEKLFLRGTNRHQEYPYIGYALSDAAQYREARRIKDAGFDYIRLSHYAHAPAFMDACDELGLVLMDSIPGWQYFGRDPAFTELQYRNCRDLIRRDRNHPSVIMWEVSLNETGMPPEFIRRTHAIAHEEYPGDQCFTAGWVHGYDVFIQARQHGGCHGEKTGPCLVSEYGDWEYYAQNAGLNQEAWAQLNPAEQNSRQLRWQGEKALLQQAANFQESHDDNRSTIAFADGLWVMYDYNRGYAPDLESSGCMDIFRLPKLSYWFYQSQRSPNPRLPNAASGPMVFIASEWTSASNPDVRVFSNCDEVGLSLNGRLLERRRPDSGRMTTHLAHPPFTFRTGGFQRGTLEAVGYVGGREAARHTVRTPGAVEKLELRFDVSGRPADRSGDDVLFCYAALTDAAGSVVPRAWLNVAYALTGPGALVGLNPLATDAGISTILVKTRPGSEPVHVYALACVPTGNSARVVAASASIGGTPQSFEIRYSTDGSEPGAGSPRYVEPVEGPPHFRAGLLVGGRVLASLAEDAPRYRTAPCAPPPPEWRGKFPGAGT